MVEKEGYNYLNPMLQSLSSFLEFILDSIDPLAKTNNTSFLSTASRIASQGDLHSLSSSSSSSPSLLSSSLSKSTSTSTIKNRIQSKGHVSLSSLSSSTATAAATATATATATISKIQPKEELKSLSICNQSTYRESSIPVSTRRASDATDETLSCSVNTDDSDYKIHENMKCIDYNHTHTMNNNSNTVDKNNDVKKKRRVSKTDDYDCLEFATKYLLNNDTNTTSFKNNSNNSNGNDDYFFSGIDLDTGHIDSNIQTINVINTNNTNDNNQLYQKHTKN